MEPKDAELYDQLVGYLAAEGAVEEDTDAGVVTLTEFDHQPLAQPLHLHVTPTSLGRHLRTGASDAAVVWADVPPVEAAWRLFLVRLEAAVRTAKTGETELVLDPSGVRSQRPDQPPRRSSR
ncbi:hypothetical protein GCM10023200_16630 [Actinomycetospora chlora]|uniref:Uncharacterized protein n=1 Tax=Actinomycetospora chlora TaxID=663608 RepID=A0ABP9AN26_9PSEU